MGSLARAFVAMWGASFTPFAPFVRDLKAAHERILSCLAARPRQFRQPRGAAATQLAARGA